MTFGIFGDFKYRGYIWRSVFLETDSSMAEEDRFRIRMQIADMYLDKKSEKKIKGEDYEGRITTNNKSYLLGGFWGQEFDVILETNHGKSKLSLLVAELVDVSLN
jgi:hypothetical protein